MKEPSADNNHFPPEKSTFNPGRIGEGRAEARPMPSPGQVADCEYNRAQQVKGETCKKVQAFHVKHLRLATEVINLAVLNGGRIPFSSPSAYLRRAS